MNVKSRGIAGSGQYPWLKGFLTSNEAKATQSLSKTGNKLWEMIENTLCGNGIITKKDLQDFTNAMRDSIKLLFSRITPQMLIFGVIFIVLGILLGYLIHRSFLWKYISKSPIFLFSKIIYFILWIAILYFCFTSKKFHNYLTVLNINNFKGVSTSIVVSLVASFVIYLVFYVTTFIGTKLMFIFYPFVTIGISYILLIFMPSDSPPNLRILTFFISFAIFMILFYFFYSYLNKSGKNVRKALNKILMYFPIIAIFILFTAAFQFIQLEALRFMLIPDQKVSVLSLIYNSVIYGIPTDYHSYFIFSLCVGIIYNIVSNLNIVFACSLISNKLLFGEMRIMDSLKFCFDVFGNICYVSMFPSFFSSMRSTLIVIAGIFEKSKIFIVSDVVGIVIYSLNHILAGLESFFCSYNQINFVVLAYENSLKNKKLALEKEKIEIEQNDSNTVLEQKDIENVSDSTIHKSTLNESALQKHPMSLILNIPGFINSIFGTKPDSIYAFLFLNKEKSMNDELKKYMFPSFLCLQTVFEFMILIRCTLILIEEHEYNLSAENQKNIQKEESQGTTGTSNSADIELTLSEDPKEEKYSNEVLQSGKNILDPEIESNGDNGDTKPNRIIGFLCCS